MAEWVCVMSYECRGQAVRIAMYFRSLATHIRLATPSKCEEVKAVKIWKLMFSLKKKWNNNNWNGKIRFACHRIAFNPKAELCIRFPLLNRRTHAWKVRRKTAFVASSFRMTAAAGLTLEWRPIPERKVDGRAHIYFHRELIFLWQIQNWLSTVNARIRATRKIHHKRKGIWDSSAKLNLFLSINASFTQRLNHPSFCYWFWTWNVFRASGRRVQPYGVCS